MKCIICLEELIRQGHLLINIVGGSYPECVRVAALGRMRRNVGVLHWLKEEQK
jgi:hypothetical protein